jgi:hypothetical protein
MRLILPHMARQTVVLDLGSRVAFAPAFEAFGGCG